MVNPLQNIKGTNKANNLAKISITEEYLECINKTN